MKKEFTITKEQLMNLNEETNIVTSEKLTKWFPQAFESELEVGKWYIWKTTRDVLLFITNFEGDKLKGYGIENGLWFDNRDTSNYWGYKNDNFFELATDKEVKTALIAEAKRRGFNNTTMITQTFNKNQEMCIGFWNESSVKFERNKLFANGVRIFDNGKWAEIISEPIEVTLEEIAEKFNVNVEQLKIKK